MTHRGRFLYNVFDVDLRNPISSALQVGFYAYDTRPAEGQCTTARCEMQRFFFKNQTELVKARDLREENANSNEQPLQTFDQVLVKRPLTQSTRVVVGLREEIVLAEFSGLVLWLGGHYYAPGAPTALLHLPLPASNS